MAGKQTNRGRPVTQEDNQGQVTVTRDGKQHDMTHEDEPYKIKREPIN